MTGFRQTDPTHESASPARLPGTGPNLERPVIRMYKISAQSAIAKARHTMPAAGTGSGITLAALIASTDALIRRGVASVLGL